MKEKQKTEKVKDFYYPCKFWITLIRVFKSTGIRRNQLLHIRICDINEKNKTILLQEQGSKTYLEREIPILPGLFNELLDLKKSLALKRIHPEKQLFNIYNFKNNRSKKYKEMDFNRIDSFFQQLSKACQNRITPHRFRHTLATQLMREPDRNLTIVKELLGHSSISTTIQYIETDVEQLRNCLTNYFQK